VAGGVRASASPPQRWALQMQTMTTTDEVFAAMGEAVSGDGGKALQRKFKVSVQSFGVHEEIGALLNSPNACTQHDGQGTVTFTITPSNKTYSLDLSSLNSSVSEGDIFNNNADLAVTCSEDIMIKMINKEVQPQQAFMKGMLKIKGKMGLAMKLTSVLAATRKKLPKAKL
jgi:putative sterol carrier protein